MDNKYSNGKIYKIVDETNGNVYIGSTIKDLDRRLREHFNDYKIYLRGKRTNITSFAIIKNALYHIELVEVVVANNKEELHARERFHIANTPNCINKYRKLNLTRDELLNDWNQYYAKNKAEINANRNAKYVCFCGCQISKSHKAEHSRSQRHANFIKTIKELDHKHNRIIKLIDIIMEDIHLIPKNI
jgi:predicted GIY-YIG superfamily endonuclease